MRPEGWRSQCQLYGTRCRERKWNRDVERIHPCEDSKCCSFHWSSNSHPYCILHRRDPIICSVVSENSHGSFLGQCRQIRNNRQ